MVYTYICCERCRERCVEIKGQDAGSIEGGLKEVITKQKINYVEMEKHFNEEIEKIIKRKFK